MHNEIDKSRIPVFFCTDNRYAIPTYIVMYSLIENYKGKQDLTFCILIPGDFSKKNTELLRSLSAKNSLVQIMFVEVGSQYDEITINTPWISTATMYRLLIPQIAEKLWGTSIDKCLYLDSDIVVEGNIAELYNTDVKEYCIAGVKEKIISCNTDPEMRRLLGVPTLENYINAGVMLINLQEIRKYNLSKELENAGYRSDYLHNDQDAINAIFYGKIKILPLKFNAINLRLNDDTADSIEQYGISSILEARRDPIIVHYISEKKTVVL